MEQDWPEETPPAESRVRALGFDPTHLTPAEQEELLALHVACPDAVLEARAAPA